MPNNNTGTVVSDPSGGWDARGPGAAGASFHHDTQAEAERAAAKDVVRQSRRWRDPHPPTQRPDPRLPTPPQRRPDPPRDGKR